MSKANKGSACGPQPRLTDLIMCDFKTEFCVIGQRLLLLDIRTFLTQSQVDNGATPDWFKSQHYSEMMELIQSVASKYINVQSQPKAEKNMATKDVISTGNSVRIACSFKPCDRGNSYLVSKCVQSGGQTKSIHQELKTHHEKLVVFVCPRSSSSFLQLSQLVNNNDLAASQEDISKYFTSVKAGPKKSTR